MKRSLLVQTLLDMATGSGGAKLEELIVDAAGTFDAGSGKGYNPVTVPSGTINVLGEKGVVSNNSVVVTPRAQVVRGWLNSGETSGSGVGVTASELVSGTLNVSSDGVQDVTNYQNISVPSAGHSASAHKGVVTDHSIIVTPRSTTTQGFVQAGTVEGTSVSISASELVSGILSITQSGEHDVTNYQKVDVAIDKILHITNSSVSKSIGGLYGNRELTVTYTGNGTFEGFWLLLDRTVARDSNEVAAILYLNHNSGTQYEVMGLGGGDNVISLMRASYTSNTVTIKPMNTSQYRFYSDANVYKVYAIYS